MSPNFLGVSQVNLQSPLCIDGYGPDDIHYERTKKKLASGGISPKSLFTGLGPRRVLEHGPLKNIHPKVGNLGHVARGRSVFILFYFIELRRGQGARFRTKKCCTLFQGHGFGAESILPGKISAK